MNTNSRIKTWRQRIGAGPDFPLHAPTDVERAMVEKITELRGMVAASTGNAPQQAAAADVLTVPLAIMNIKVDHFQSDEYKRGHRDARHTAADLVLELADKLLEIAQVGPNKGSLADDPRFRQMMQEYLMGDASLEQVASRLEEWRNGHAPVMGGR